MMNVLYEDNHIIVIEKPVNQPVQLDSSNDYDLVTALKDYLKEKYNKPGNVYVGLVHRLDRPVGGVMVFAKTSKAASRLSQQVSTRGIEKIYKAVVIGDMKPGFYEDKLLKNNKTNTSYVDPKGKLSKMEVLESHFNNEHNISLLTINLITGRSHQIRVQCASRYHYLWGDARYNPSALPKQQIALWAYQITFMHPTLKKSMTFTCPTPNRYPFTLW